MSENLGTLRYVASPVLYSSAVIFRVFFCKLIRFRAYVNYFTLFLGFSVMHFVCASDQAVLGIVISFTDF